jgi:hypothetical protein
MDPVDGIPGIYERFKVAGIGDHYIVLIAIFLYDGFHQERGQLVNIITV